MTKVFWNECKIFGFSLPWIKLNVKNAPSSVSLIETVLLTPTQGGRNQEETHQKTNSGAPTLSLSSQEMVTLSPRLTCFSLDPSTVALGWLTVSRVTRVRIPVVVAAWSKWYFKTIVYFNLITIGSSLKSSSNWVSWQDFKLKVSNDADQSGEYDGLPK